VTIGELADSEAQPVAIATVVVITKATRNPDVNIVAPLKGGCWNSNLVIWFNPCFFTNTRLQNQSEN
jgi:hypothetical protein